MTLSRAGCGACDVMLPPGDPPAPSPAPACPPGPERAGGMGDIPLVLADIADTDMEEALETARWWWCASVGAAAAAAAVPEPPL